MSEPLILEIQSGKYKGRQVKLTDSHTIIGRGDDARIRIASEEVSREHCVLVVQGNSLLVRDLESRNGTFVDGRPIQGERLLSPGGTLTVGPMTFRLLGDPAALAATPGSDVAIGGKKATSDSLSDDDIASWLSDDEVPTSAGLAADTKIIKGTAQALPATPAPAVAPAPPPSAAATPRRREFKSVSDEAQDIIRRHYEMLSREDSQP